MLKDHIQSSLQQFRENTEDSRIFRESFCRQSPLERWRSEIHQQLLQSEAYRLSILQNVNTFGKTLVVSMLPRSPLPTQSSTQLSLAISLVHSLTD
jgi:hypothetical protein